MPVSLKPSERIARLADRIEAVLDANARASANPEALAQLLGAAAELGGGDAYTSAKLVELMAKAQIFYSARGFFRLPGTAQRMWNDMRHDLLDRIRMRSRVLAAQGD